MWDFYHEFSVGATLGGQVGIQCGGDPGRPAATNRIGFSVGKKGANK